MEDLSASAGWRERGRPSVTANPNRRVSRSRSAERAVDDRAREQSSLATPRCLLLTQPPCAAKSASLHSGSQKKWYAVAVGAVPGIYNSWPEAEKQVKDFSHNKHKSFPSREGAVAYLADFRGEAPAVTSEIPSAFASLDEIIARAALSLEVKALPVNGPAAPVVSCLGKRLGVPEERIQEVADPAPSWWSESVHGSWGPSRAGQIRLRAARQEAAGSLHAVAARPLGSQVACPPATAAAMLCTLESPVTALPMAEPLLGGMPRRFSPAVAGQSESAGAGMGGPVGALAHTVTSVKSVDPVEWRGNAEAFKPAWWRGQWVGIPPLPSPAAACARGQTGPQAGTVREASRSVEVACDLLTRAVSASLPGLARGNETQHPMVPSRTNLGPGVALQADPAQTVSEQRTPAAGSIVVSASNAAAPASGIELPASQPSPASVPGPVQGAPGTVTLSDAQLAALAAHLNAALAGVAQDQAELRRTIAAVAAVTAGLRNDTGAAFNRVAGNLGQAEHAVAGALHSTAAATVGLRNDTWTALSGVAKGLGQSEWAVRSAAQSAASDSASLRNDTAGAFSKVAEGLRAVCAATLPGQVHQPQPVPMQVDEAAVTPPQADVERSQSQQGVQQSVPPLGQPGGVAPQAAVKAEPQPAAPFPSVKPIRSQGIVAGMYCALKPEVSPSPSAPAPSIGSAFVEPAECKPGPAATTAAARAQQHSQSQGPVTPAPGVFSADSPGAVPAVRPPPPAGVGVLPVRGVPVSPIPAKAKAAATPATSAFRGGLTEETLDADPVYVSSNLPSGSGFPGPPYIAPSPAPPPPVAPIPAPGPLAGSTVSPPSLLPEEGSSADRAPGHRKRSRWERAAQSSRPAIAPVTAPVPTFATAPVTAPVPTFAPFLAKGGTAQVPSPATSPAPVTATTAFAAFSALPVTLTASAVAAHVSVSAAASVVSASVAALALAPEAASVKSAVSAPASVNTVASVRAPVVTSVESAVPAPVPVAASILTAASAPASLVAEVTTGAPAPAPDAASEKTVAPALDAASVNTVAAVRGPVVAPVKTFVPAPAPVVASVKTAVSAPATVAASVNTVAPVLAPVVAPVKTFVTAPAPVVDPVETTAPAPATVAASVNTAAPVRAPVVAPVETAVPAPVPDVASVKTAVSAPATVAASVNTVAPVRAPVVAPVETAVPAPVPDVAPVKTSVPAPVPDVAPVETSVSAPVPDVASVKTAVPAPALVAASVKAAAPAPASVKTAVPASAPAPDAASAPVANSVNFVAHVSATVVASVQTVTPVPALASATSAPAAASVSAPTLAKGASAAASVAAPVAASGKTAVTAPNPVKIASAAVLVAATVKVAPFAAPVSAFAPVMVTSAAAARSATTPSANTAPISGPAHASSKVVAATQPCLGWSRAPAASTARLASAAAPASAPVATIAPILASAPACVISSQASSTQSGPTSAFLQAAALAAAQHRARTQAEIEVVVRAQHPFAALGILEPEDDDMGGVPSEVPQVRATVPVQSPHISSPEGLSSAYQIIVERPVSSSVGTLSTFLWVTSAEFPDSVLRRYNRASGNKAVRLVFQAKHLYARRSLGEQGVGKLAVLHSFCNVVGGAGIQPSTDVSSEVVMETPVALPPPARLSAVGSQGSFPPARSGSKTLRLGKRKFPFDALGPASFEAPALHAPTSVKGFALRTESLADLDACCLEARGFENAVCVTLRTCATNRLLYLARRRAELEKSLAKPPPSGDLNMHILPRTEFKTPAVVDLMAVCASHLNSPVAQAPVAPAAAPFALPPSALAASVLAPSATAKISSAAAPVSAPTSTTEFSLAVASVSALALATAKNASAAALISAPTSTAKIASVAAPVSALALGSAKNVSAAPGSAPTPATAKIASAAAPATASAPITFDSWQDEQWNVAQVECAFLYQERIAIEIMVADELRRQALLIAAIERLYLHLSATAPPAVVPEPPCPNSQPHETFEQWVARRQAECQTSAGLFRAVADANTAYLYPRAVPAPFPLPADLPGTAKWRRLMHSRATRGSPSKRYASRVWAILRLRFRWSGVRSDDKRRSYDRSVGLRRDAVSAVQPMIRSRHELARAELRHRYYCGRLLLWEKECAAVKLKATELTRSLGTSLAAPAPTQAGGLSPAFQQPLDTAQPAGGTAALPFLIVQTPAIVPGNACDSHQTAPADVLLFEHLAAPRDQLLRVRVHPLSGRRFWLEGLRMSDRVCVLKQRIVDAEGGFVAEFGLAGQPAPGARRIRLPEIATLAECGLCNGSDVYVSCWLKGGGRHKAKRTFETALRDTDTASDGEEGQPPVAPEAQPARRPEARPEAPVAPELGGFRCPSDGCAVVSRPSDDNSKFLRQHYNEQHSADRVVVLAAKLPASVQQCSRCFTLQLLLKGGGLHKHGQPPCVDPAAAVAAQRKRKDLRVEQVFPAPLDHAQQRERTTAERLENWRPFDRYARKPKWLRVITALLEVLAAKASVQGAATIGSEPNRLVQEVGYKVMRSPWHVPRHFLPSAQRGVAQRQRAQAEGAVSNQPAGQRQVKQAVRIMEGGEHSKAMQTLYSRGLAEASAANLARLRAMFGDDEASQALFAPDFAAHIPPVSAVLPPAAAVAEVPDDDMGIPPPVPQAAAVVADAAADAAGRAAMAAAGHAAAAGNAEPAADSPWSRTLLGRFLRKKLTVASDFLGWNAGSLLYLVQNLNSVAYSGLIAWFQLIDSGAIDLPLLRAELRRSRGHILRKPKDGLRAIGVVSWWIQVPSCIVLRASIAEVVRLVGPENVAIGVRGGSDAIARAVQLYLAQFPTHVAVATDCTAAFPSITRLRLLEAADLIKALSRNAHLHLEGANTISFVGEDGAVDNVFITKGGNTGCAKLPALFTIAVQRALKDLRLRHPQVRIVGQMDDHTLLGPLDACLAALDDMILVFRQQLGLELNASKNAIVGGESFAATPLQASDLAARDMAQADGHKFGGVPVGKDSFITEFLASRFSEFEQVAVTLEGILQSEQCTVAWQAMLGLVSQCVAPSFNHLARTVVPSLMRPFAVKFDARLTLLALRASGHWRTADEALAGDALLQGRLCLLPSAWGGLGIQSLAASLDAAFVGAAALIGPAVKGLVPSIDFDVDTSFRRELSAAIERLQPAIRLAQPKHFVAAEAADGPDPEDDDRPSMAVLQSLSADTIYDSSLSKVQSALAAKVACVEAVALRLALQEGEVTAEAARFVDRWQPGASAWLHANRKDPDQHMKNAHFRIAVGALLNINCFPEVDAATPCPCCSESIGPVMRAHMRKCKAVYTGGNNKRHNALQQRLLILLRAAGANVVPTPGVTSFTGAQPLDASHAGRMVDLGARGLDNGHDLAIDLCVSDCGTGSPPKVYMSGAKSEAKGKEKRQKYIKRFPDIPQEELCCPSYGETGTRNKEALGLQKRIINSIAAADLTIPRSLVAARISQVLSVAVQVAAAFNVLEYRYVTLIKGRGVAGQPVPGGEDWEEDGADGRGGVVLPVPALAPQGGLGAGQVAIGLLAAAVQVQGLLGVPLALAAVADPAALAVPVGPVEGAVPVLSGD